MILIDTSGLLAALFPDQNHHQACARALLQSRGPYYLSPFVLAELDYLVHKLAGIDAELEFLAEVARGAYQLVELAVSDVAAARSIIVQHRDLGIGLADASIVALSRRLGISDVLTLDERHFRVLRGPGSQPFRLLPADL